MPRPTAGAALGAVLAWLGLGATSGAQPMPPEPVRELRAAWVTPVQGGDWPSRPGMSVEEQKAELGALMDRARDIGLNAVILHVRTAGDALYPTAQAPWSRYLVGREGTAVARGYDDYDPLALAVAEAHARGLQLHAWFNPFRAMPPDDLGAPLAGHVARAHPDWVRKYGRSTWIDPGIPAARAAVLDAILDVVARYDIDAVHLDDYFYPYLEQETVTRVVKRGKKRVRVAERVTLDFPDAASWKRYGVGRGWTDRAAWRRANVNDFVRTLYHEVKAKKPWVLVGISPFGIWRPGSPPGITGLDAYKEIFADSRLWLREGWLDYLAPQLYWPLDGAQSRFARLDAWWRSENVLGRHVWPGLFTMRVGSRQSPWPRGEIAAEILALRGARRGTTESLGHVHFRMGTLGRVLDGDSAAFGDVLRAAVYDGPALPPASPWLGAAVPAVPRLTVADEPADDLSGPGDPSTDGRAALQRTLTFAAGDTVTVRWWLIQRLGVDGTWRAQLLPAGSSRLPLTAADSGATWTAVRAISPTGISSHPAVVR
jgi:uncharacterized lipoprotein YddW (UPF0748 family)